MNKLKLLARLIIVITLGILILNFNSIVNYGQSSTTSVSNLKIGGSIVTLIQLTDNEEHEIFPQIHNGMVTWEGYDGNDYEIFLYDGITKMQLTDNGYQDYYPQIHNGMVTWCGDYDSEIFLYDGTTKTQLTDNGEDDYDSQIHNGMVTWNGYDGNDYEIFLYDGTTKTQLTNNEYEDYYPQIHNGMVTWCGYDGHDYEIFLYDGTTKTQLTDNGEDDYDSQIHNGMVTWNGYDGNDYEIFLYDGTTKTQLTNNEYEDYYPQIHNGMVTWCGYDGHDYEIFLYDGTTKTQLTDNGEDDYDSQIHNGMVTWNGYDGNDYEIFLYDGTTKTQLTNNEYDDWLPQIHNGMVTWCGYDGHDYEIFLAITDITPPIFEELMDVVVCEQGISQSITWMPYDDNPYSYQVIMKKIEPDSSNWIEIESGSWSGESISIDIIEPTAGTYAYVCTVHDKRGFSSSNLVLVIVYGEDGEPVTQRLQLELSGSFDFLEKEKIHLQIAGLLTEFFSGDTVSEATVTFDVYHPNGTKILDGEMIEQVADSGVYIYKADLTMKEMDLPKGIYWIYAQAETSEGLKAVDMIQFHIDPPGDQEFNPWLILTIVGFGGIAFMSVVVIFMWRNYRGITH
ncbi:MAG: TolB family protein [Candidatus Thorarchaeota archaeon]